MTNKKKMSISNQTTSALQLVFFFWGCCRAGLGLRGLWVLGCTWIEAGPVVTACFDGTMGPLAEESGEPEDGGGAKGDEERWSRPCC